jgi:hypothetical protein
LSWLANHDLVDVEAVCTKVVDGGVARVTDGDAIQEPVILRNLEFAPNHVFPGRERTLGTGAEATGVCRKHQVLHEQARVVGGKLAQRLVREDL